MQPITWIALSYQVPIEPSKARVYVWRKLKELGAGYLKQGVALLPRSPQNLAKLRALAAKIRELGGEATLAELRFLDRFDEEDMVARFQRQSQGEYRALIEEITGLRDNMRQSRPAGDRADHVRRMEKRYGQVRSRDYFKSRAVPDIATSIDGLVGDMIHATDSLARHFAQILLED
jgi:hypothetical protein